MTEPDLLHAALETFNVALGRLEAALDQPPTEWTRDAAIQRFEFGDVFHLPPADGSELLLWRRLLRLRRRRVRRERRLLSGGARALRLRRAEPPGE
jgi:hypothetical protein